MILTHKSCARCGEEKPATFEFFARRYGRLSMRCRRCEVRLNAARNKERHLTDWVERMLAYARSHDRTSASYQRTDLDREHIEGLYLAQAGRCALTGVELSTEMGRLDSVSLDRRDAARGCVKGNVQLTSLCANLARNSFSDADMRLFIRMVKDAKRSTAKRARGAGATRKRG